MGTGPTIPTVQEVRSWQAPALLQWIQKALAVPLKPENAQKFLNAEISGQAFLLGAGQRDFFREAEIPLGPSIILADLVKTIVGESKSYFINTLSFAHVLLPFIPLFNANYAHLPGISFASPCPAPFKKQKMASSFAIPDSILSDHPFSPRILTVFPFLGSCSAPLPLIIIFPISTTSCLQPGAAF
jgi:hypothetical protein